jgi:hypothetical protein
MVPDFKFFEPRSVQHRGPGWRFLWQAADRFIAGSLPDVLGNDQTTVRSMSLRSGIIWAAALLLCLVGLGLAWADDIDIRVSGDVIPQLFVAVNRMFRQPSRT